jgi:GDP/UDP-N,N'-diacetylbacillosamine 2-epimerase (hydrolysing)
VLLVQHPVTEQVRLAGAQMATTLSALKRLGVQVVLVYPNNDAGSVELRATIEEFRGPWLHVERNLSRRDYAGLLQEADAMVGNSSSGLLEAPSFRLPAVNIGRRQEGRMRGDNVIDVDHDVDAIAAAVEQALSPEFRDRLSGENPYGDGRASERIVRVLAETPIDEALLYKRLTF